MKKPSIDIVIPSFNQQDYLADAIDSALEQSTPAKQIIVVEDGSTDKSLEIAKGYGKKIKLINQVNKGLPSARNAGIMNSTADYVLFLDADDILLENCIEKITEVIKESKADVVSPSFKTFGVL